MIADSQVCIEELEARIQSLEDENRALKVREQTILRSLPEIVFMVDLNERFVFLNNVCREKFKLMPDVLDYNVHLKDLIAPESLVHLRKLYLRNGDKEVIQAKELIGICRNNNKFTFTAFFSKLYENGNLSGFIGIGFDLTEHISIEKKLSDANLAKMKFLSIIAHDLRNPFNSLVGFSTLLLTNFERYPTEKVKEYVQHMNNAANQGYQLLENLLDWARANMRKIDVNPIVFDLEYVVKDSLNLISGSATKKEISIVLNNTDNIQAFADHNMIRTVIRNILSNAIKFTPRKGNVIINTFRNKDHAIVEIADNGVGIKGAQLKNLFCLNNEYTSLGTEREKGTGLGLMLCYEFIQINKGIIEADSVPGVGSTFRISIPLFNASN